MAVRFITFVVCALLSASALAQSAERPKRSLDDIVNNEDNPFKVRNAPKPTSDLETERMLMQLGRKSAVPTAQCVQLTAVDRKTCNSGNYVGLCLRNSDLAAQNQRFCETYQRLQCAKACKEPANDPAADAKERREMVDYMDSLSGPTTNTTDDARANCLKRNPGKRRLCGYPN